MGAIYETTTYGAGIPEFMDTVRKYIDRRLSDMTEGKTDPAFKDKSDASLIFELIARGYQVSKPPA